MMRMNAAAETEGRSFAQAAALYFQEPLAAREARRARSREDFSKSCSHPISPA